MLLPERSLQMSAMADVVAFCGAAGQSGRAAGHSLGALGLFFSSFESLIGWGSDHFLPDEANTILAGEPSNFDRLSPPESPRSSYWMLWKPSQGRRKTFKLLDAQPFLIIAACRSQADNLLLPMIDLSCCL